MYRLIFTPILIFSLLPGYLLAQRINALVTDRLTKIPVGNASVKATGLILLTSPSGFFSIVMHIGDTALIRHSGYAPFKLKFDGRFITDTLRIMLEPVIVKLNEVNIRAFRNYKKDSLASRREYAKAFAYKPPGLKEVLGSRTFTKYEPYAYNTAPNNTTTILNINLLALVKFIGKNKAPEYRLQKTLLKDEDANYVDYRFTRQKVTAATALHGDSLQRFMDLYRLPASLARKMTDYELLGYIKKSYAEFLKNKLPEYNSPFNH